MKIHFYSPNRIEPWDYRNVWEVGIGGSETSHVEMATRLAKRGHDVISYTELPEDQVEHDAHGVQWKDLKSANLENDGLWIVYRSPSTGAMCKPTNNRRYWLVCQDIWYPDYKSDECKSFERIIGLCPRHIADMHRRDPSAGNRICMSSNGVNVERINELEWAIYEKKRPPIQRIPHRLIWASSPDRGLQEMLWIFERAREQVPQLELKIYYGMDNINKICRGDRKKHPWKKSWDVYEKALDTEGVEWVGRVGQDRLREEWMAAGIWCYPTWFQETSCIACMEAQALGAIPVTNPIWATGYNVKHGCFIEGDQDDKLVKCRYVDAVARMASNPQRQEHIRLNMIPEARKRLSWEVWVDQWEQWVDISFPQEKTRKEIVCS